MKYWKPISLLFLVVGLISFALLTPRDAAPVEMMDTRLVDLQLKHLVFLMIIAYFFFGRDGKS